MASDSQPLPRHMLAGPVLGPGTAGRPLGAQVCVKGFVDVAILRSNSLLEALARWVTLDGVLAKEL